MRTAFLWVVLPVLAAAQVSVEVTGATPTQAVLQIRGATAPCIIDLREGAADGALHPDVTASVDTLRSDTSIWQDGTRIVTLGHQRSNLALAAGTDYYGTVSSCGAATFSFRTAMPPLGATMPIPLPVNPANWDNADFPEIDFSPSGRDKWYVDPVTGRRIFREKDRLTTLFPPGLVVSAGRTRRMRLTARRVTMPPPVMRTHCFCISIRSIPIRVIRPSRMSR